MNSPHVWLRLRSAETHDDYNPDDEETIPKSETESEQIRNGLKKNEIFAGCALATATRPPPFFIIHTRSLADPPRLACGMGAQDLG